VHSSKVLVLISTLACATGLVAPAAATQSCPAADATLGPSKSKGHLRSSYDKFTDSTSLESNDQGYAFLGQNEIIKISLVAKHAGKSAGPMSVSLHLNGTHQLNGGTKAAQTPDRFADSTSAILLADTARFALRGNAHRIARNEFSIIGPPTIVEDLYFPMTTEQLAALARAQTGGIRIGEFDLPMRGKLAEGADAVYRSLVCALASAGAGSR
jgi:hypothetical protein